MAETSAASAQRIALDVMGGDHAPGEIVAGAVQAARAYGAGVILVGPEPAIRAEMARQDISGLDLTIEHTDEVVRMDEHPAEAVRARKRNTITLCMELVRDGRAGGMVSAGNSGAVVAAALFTLKRVAGVSRPALGTVLPTASGRPTLLLDVGATTDSKPNFLAQFALMGSAYMKSIFGVAQPKVALLANGEETNKGDQLVQAAHVLIRDLASQGALTFAGNVEGRDIPAGDVDVIVCDGFVGNVALKLSEGLSKMLLGTIRQEIYASTVNKIGGLLLKGAFNNVRAKLDYEEYGGAPLLGVRGTVIISHGSSHAKAIKNAIRVARQAAEERVPDNIAAGMAATAATTADASATETAR
jgi:glycerol-3-phosphate acyltransferase PlsX